LQPFRLTPPPELLLPYQPLLERHRLVNLALRVRSAYRLCPVTSFSLLLHALRHHSLVSPNLFLPSPIALFLFRYDSIPLPCIFLKHKVLRELGPADVCLPNKLQQTKMQR
jgi:hypothetical protein